MNLLVVLEDNYNDIELVTPLSIWKKSNCFNKITFYHPNLKQIQGQFGYSLINTIENNIDINEYDLMFIPGGKAANTLRNNQISKDLISKFFSLNKDILAICDAPNTLREFNVINDEKFTSYPSVWSSQYRIGENYTSNSVELSNKLITAKSANVAKEFAYKVLNHYFGFDKTKDTYQAISGNQDITELKSLLKN
ncbi:DJ-1/PfpI family protein [Mycoplasmopsis felis]|uniref:DJ-1/PfpI family protein n=1 Tax=Mycoplasmopsis felis TaxID=33923 RepID=UPI000561B6EA|nr:DJ-1/PfpI family protein [Mycoplasmopsis felis]